MRGRLIGLATAVIMGLSSTPAEAHVIRSCKKNPCKRHVVKPFNDRLLRIARCESSLRWFLDGRYDGGLQFDPGTWNATGSSYRFAYQAPILEQKYRGVVWAQMIGFAWGTRAGWPVCGNR